MTFLNPLNFKIEKKTPQERSEEEKKCASHIRIFAYSHTTFNISLLKYMCYAFTRQIIAKAKLIILLILSVIRF